MRRVWSRPPARRRLGRVALAGGLCLLLGGGSAVAAPAWLPAVDVSVAGADATVPQVAVDSRGDATAVWERFNGTNSIVQAALRPAGGAWQAPIDLSVPGQDAFDAVVALDAQGVATAVWDRFNGSNHIVQAAIRPWGGVWQAPVDLSVAGGDAGIPQVALDAHGDATAVWIRSDGTNYIVQAAIRPAGGTWQAPVDLSVPGQEAREPGIAVNAQGDATAIWRRSNGTNYIVQSATRPAGSTWQAPVDLSVAGQSALGPRVAVDSQGDATAVWQRPNGANSIVQAALRPAGGVWQAPVDVSVGGQDAFDPEVVLDAQGVATAVWDRFNGSNYIVQSAIRPAGGVWQAPVDLSVTGQNVAIPQVALDTHGNADAVWERSNGATDIVQGAIRPAGGTWQAPVDLSAPGQNAVNPQIAFDLQGDATAVWQRFNATNYIVQAAGYDAAGPQLRGVSIPTSGTAGVPVSLSVTPLDVWSPIASTSWSFGDGQSATGANITHTYNSPGRYPIALNSTDSLANTTSTTATITIKPAQPSTVPSSAPALSNVSQTHRNWREGTRQATLARIPRRNAPIGTTFAFTLNQAARVTLAFSQTAGGRRASGSCQAPSNRNRGRPRCTRAITRGTLAYRVQSGRHRLAFQGRVAGKRLPLGAYMLTINATNTTTNRHARPNTLHFTIVR